MFNSPGFFFVIHFILITITTAVLNAGGAHAQSMSSTAAAVDAVISQTAVVEADQGRSERSQLNAVVANLEVLSERSEKLVCLSKQWFEVDAVLGMLLVTFRKSQAAAFQDVATAPRTALCFYPALISPAGEEQLAKIFLRVDRLTQNHTAVIALRDSDGDVQGSLAQRFEAEKKNTIRRVWRAEKYVGGTEAVGMALLLMLPPSVTKWEENPLQSWKFQRAWSKAPVWDHDEWYINYIGHPVAGAIYYNSLRSQGAGMLQSFAFSTAQSVAWEYLIESWAEQPSIQDLLFTSTIGSLYGEASHRATLQMRKKGFKLWEKAIVTIINPMYVVMNGYK